MFEPSKELWPVGLSYSYTCFSDFNLSLIHYSEIIIGVGSLFKVLMQQKIILDFGS